MNTQPVTDTRAAILKAASTLLLTHSYSSLSMNQIADMCEISKPAIYHHFKNKEALVSETIISTLESGTRIIDRHSSKDISVEERVSLIFMDFIELAKDNPGIQLIYMRGMMEEEMSSIMVTVEPHLELLVRQVGEVFINGYSTGEIRKDADPFMAAGMFLNGVAMCSLSYSRHGKLIIPGGVEFVDYLFRGLSPRENTEK